MEQEDLKLLTDWLEENKDHKLNFVEKEAIKMAVRKAGTVGDLVRTALDLLKKCQGRPGLPSAGHAFLNDTEGSCIQIIDNH